MLEFERRYFDVSTMDEMSEATFFFSSSFRTLIGSDLEPIGVPPNPTPQQLLAVATEALGADDRTMGNVPTIVGAIPFFNTSSSALFLSKVNSSPAFDVRAGESSPSLQRPTLARIRAVPEPDDYVHGVRIALDLIEAGRLEKVVLARTLEIDLVSDLDTTNLLSTLTRRNQHGFTFVVPVMAAQQEVRHLFLGASPELLVRRVGRMVTSNPLAGSTRRGATPEEDRRNAEALLSSAKDRHEHDVVVAAVKRSLQPFCSNLDVPSTPSLLQTPTVWHLSTVITGELADPMVSALELALALHPTPAVCGQPTELSGQAIAAIEPFKRDLYAGLVGWSDVNGDGEWAVAIRCAEVRGRWIRLFAGAGIVRGSNPEAELAETAAKLRTMLTALGIEGENTP
ncbi:isochorismate synthase [Bradyrhizobium sp. Leo121]|uniref:isochorismate synthase n=1 Tax=Bradyrhizobium sp. Leo121 TaxID=1571195 RepID=UPI001029763D|nr:isochorismate synthase [Bradyrhizobium sp. Leo121]RZN31715.1 isochorismate synthase [Bradyrhizobium sp. Leo121]